MIDKDTRRDAVCIHIQTVRLRTTVDRYLVEDKDIRQITWNTHESILLLLLLRVLLLLLQLLLDTARPTAAAVSLMVLSALGLRTHLATTTATMNLLIQFTGTIHTRVYDLPGRPRKEPWLHSCKLYGQYEKHLAADQSH